VPAADRTAFSTAFAFGRDSSPLYYSLSGRPDGLPIVLSDGVGCDGYIWKYLRPALEEEHRVIHWHYRGHGLTPPPRAPERVELTDFADDLCAVLEHALGDEGRNRPVVLAGHSLGVQTCLEAYRRLGTRVHGFVFLCGSSGTPLRTFKGSDNAERLLPLAVDLFGLMPQVVRGLWRNVLKTELSYQVATRLELNGELIRREDFFPYLEHMADRVDPQLFLRVLSSAARHTAADLLDHIDVPTLIIAGDRDGFTPAHLSETMAARIAGSELMMVPGGSHTAPIERPVEITNRVISFLRERVRS
jgi:pimeloyl-ACP methyl ester carboxylesterase